MSNQIEAQLDSIYMNILKYVLSLILTHLFHKYNINEVITKALFDKKPFHGICVFCLRSKMQVHVFKGISFPFIALYYNQ